MLKSDIMKKQGTLKQHQHNATFKHKSASLS
jgi:hypothetical protein